MSNPTNASDAKRVDMPTGENSQSPITRQHGLQAEDRHRELSAELEQKSRVVETVLSSITDFAYTFDRDGRFVYANKALLDLWGLQLNDAVGKNFFDLKYPPELAEKLQRQIQQVIETKKPLSDKTPYTSSTGAGGFYEYIFSPVFAADGSVELVAGSTRDITEHQRVVEALALALQAGRLGTWQLDLQTMQLTCSDVYRANVGQPPGAAFTYSMLWEAIHPDDRDATQNALRHAIERKEDYAAEYRVTWPDDSLHWISVHGHTVYDANGQPLRLTGVSQEVTDRKLTEERERQAAAEAIVIAEANAKFRTFFDQGPQFAGVMTLDGTIIEANRLCLDACGFTRDQVIGKKFWDCGWWNPSPALMELVRAGSMQAASGRIFHQETKYFVADGSERFVDLTLSPVTDESGRVLFIAPTGTDITEKKQLAEERERLLDAERAARAEAERASRLKDEFLATLSHELRTPLNAILGWSQILRRQSGNDKELDEGLAIIERNSRMQAQLIEDLLDMSRIISGKLRMDVQEMNLTEITNAAIEAVRPAAEAKEIRIQKVLDTHIGATRGDSARLQQVIWNLLSNAVKFTPRGGKVQVALERVNSHVEITVTDTGLGIKPEFLPYVFERFRQADATTTRRQGGLGLGLAIVKNLVELHGGKVRAESSGEGSGATFIIELPLMVVHAADEKSTRQHPRLAEPAGVMDFPSDSAVLHGISVLVVDDEQDARELLARVLQECKAKVIIAASAAEAMELLKRERPAVLVSDIGMPEMDGYEFIRKVRSLPDVNGGRTPAAALTAFARSEDRTRALRAGYQTHIAKPVEPAELVAVVASLVNRVSKTSA